MPCTDGGVPYPPSEYELLQAKAPAMLCALLLALPGEVVYRAATQADWIGAGVTRDEFERWWVEHQRRDVMRRLRDAEAIRREKDRSEALAVLTPAQRKALGLE
jgi:hypothetical protein